MSDEIKETSSDHDRNGYIWAAIVLILILVVLGIWMFHTKSVTLSAVPGGTAMIEIAEFYVQERAWYGNEDTQIKGNPIDPESYSVYQYTCENGQITGQQTDRRSPTGTFQAFLTNNCEKDVRIEIWWFDGFALMNSFA